MAEIESIGELCQLINGYAFKPSDWSSEGTPIVRIQNLNNILAEFNYFKGKLDKKYYIDNGALLFSWSGTPGTSFGAFIWNRGPAIINQHIFRVIPKKGINLFYLKYALNGKLSDIIAKSHGGVGLQHITKKDLEKINISVPSLNIQNKIVMTLNSLENVLEKRKQQLSKLDQLVKSRFIEMFGECKTNPKNWKLLNMEEIADVGSSKRVFVEELQEEGIPFYRGTEVGALAEGESIAPELYITEEHYKKLVKATGTPQAGDLLMPSICPDGRIWVVNTKNPFYFKDGRVLWIHNIDTKFNSTFLLYSLKDRIMTDYLSIASGTTFAELKIFTLKKCKIFSVPLSLQEQFSDFVQQVDKAKLFVKQSLEKLETLKKSLMQEYFW